MNCPNCKENVSLSMSERNGIEIDYCPQCRGVWLDRGELDKIIAKSVEDQPSSIQSSPREKIQEVIYREDTKHNHKDYYKHKRKKSFLEDLFD